MGSPHLHFFPFLRSEGQSDLESESTRAAVTFPRVFVDLFSQVPTFKIFSYDPILARHSETGRAGLLGRSILDLIDQIEQSGNPLIGQGVTGDLEIAETGRLKMTIFSVGRRELVYDSSTTFAGGDLLRLVHGVTHCLVHELGIEKQINRKMLLHTSLEVPGALRTFLDVAGLFLGRRLLTAAGAPVQAPSIFSTESLVDRVETEFGRRADFMTLQVLWGSFLASLSPEEREIHRSAIFRIDARIQNKTPDYLAAIAAIARAEDFSFPENSCNGCGGPVKRGDDLCESCRVPPAESVTGEVSVVSVNLPDGEQDLVTLLSPEEAMERGLEGHEILGRFRRRLDSGGKFVPGNFIPNRTFVDFLHEWVAQCCPGAPGFQEEARRQRNGFVAVLDARTPTPQGEVLTEDILGVFEVKAGKLIPGGYKPNPNYRVFTILGFPQPPFDLVDLLRQIRRQKG